MTHFQTFESDLSSLLHTSQPEALDMAMLKILVIGDYGVGKTAIVRRYAEGRFSSNYKITVGAEFSLKRCIWENRTHLNIQLWDIAGNERFGYMTRVYYKYASAAVIVFDVSRVQTFESVKRWLADLRDKIALADDSSIPVVILANKFDIPGCNVPRSMLETLCEEKDVIGWYSTSAKENLNIDDAMHRLIRCAMKNREIKNRGADSDSISLYGEHSSKKHCFCCKI